MRKYNYSLKQISISSAFDQFSDPYENSLRPHSSYPRTSQDQQSDQSDQSICSVSAEFISTNSTINNYQQLLPNSEYFNVNDGSFTFSDLQMESVEKVSDQPSDHEESDPEESEEQTGLTTKVSPKRKKDDKNGPKKMITILNESLNPQEMKQLKKLLKRLSRIQRLNSRKGSRYGFTCSLINIRKLLGQDILEETFERFRQKLQDLEKTLNLSTEKGKYLKSLIPRYINSFRDFIAGNAQSSVEWTYDCENFKQAAYKVQGQAYVLEYSYLVLRLYDQAQL